METFYIDGAPLRAALAPTEIEVLSQRWYETPFDLYSNASCGLQKSGTVHEILCSDLTIRYYDKRTMATKGAPPEAAAAIRALKAAMQQVKPTKVALEQGDLFVLPNRRGLHARVVGEIRDPEALHRRWLLKTYNYQSREARDVDRDLFVPGRPGLIDDALCHIP